MRIFHTLFVASLIAATLAACSSLAPTQPAADTTYAITILHTNDHHGRFWQNGDGEYGMAARKTVVDTIRAEVAAAGGYSLLLDFKGMNLLGYDAMAVGNHEFDRSPAVLAMQRKLAAFPMLSANIYRQGARAFDAYKLFNLGGVRVAVLGLTTNDTPKLGNPDNMQGLEFRSPIAEAAKLVPELRQQADVVIAATHMGHYANGQHGTLAPGDVEMARAVKGLDLVVGGHTQNPACMQAENVLDTAYVPGSPCQPDRQNGTWIVQAHEWGKYVGRADFQYRNGSFTLVKYTLIPINLKQPAVANGAARTTYTTPIAENPDMLALLQPYQDFGQKKLLVAVGSSDARLEGDRFVVRKQITNLGVLIGQAMVEPGRRRLCPYCGRGAPCRQRPGSAGPHQRRFREPGSNLPDGDQPVHGGWRRRLPNDDCPRQLCGHRLCGCGGTACLHRCPQPLGSCQLCAAQGRDLPGEALRMT